MRIEGGKMFVRPSAFILHPFLVLFVALTLHCRSSRPAQPFPALGTSTREAAWSELVRLQREFPGARSLVSVRITTGEKKQSFKADLAVDRDRRLRLDGFTPLGTAAFTIFAEGSTILFLDHTANTYWRGTTRAFAERVAMFPRDVLPRDLALILLGIPAESGFQYDLSESGLSRATWSGGSAHYEPASFPPQRVQLMLGATHTVEIRHLDLSMSAERVEEPRVDRSYREAAPRISG